MTPMTPPVSATARSCSSSTLRQWRWTPAMPVWLAIVGGDGVEEAAAIDVREVDEDAMAIERAHELAAAIAERSVAAAAAKDERRCAGRAEARRRQVHERDLDEAARVEALERQIAVERVASLDADEGGVPAGDARGAIFGGRAAERDLRGRAVEDGDEAIEVLAKYGGALRRAAQRIGRDRPDGAADAGFAQARQIGLAVEARAEEAAAVAAKEVVAEDARPDEGVDVQIDDVAFAIELDCLARQGGNGCAHPRNLRCSPR
jgi:hypothetical protein